MATATTTKTIVNGKEFEAGAHVDGIALNVDELNIATMRFADATLGTNFVDDAADDIYIVTHDDAEGDFADACMGLEEAADAAVAALNAATEGDFTWDVAEGCLVLFADGEGE